MAENAHHPIIIDLNQFKLHLYLRPGCKSTFHFNTSSRRFYLSVIALIVNEMKKRKKIVSISLGKHHQLLALLNETIGGSAGSSNEKLLLSRIYRKWKDALPDLENAPLFRIIGHKKNYDVPNSRYGFDETDKDAWANLFDYKGSHEHVRLRFSIDRLGVALDDVVIIYGVASEINKPDSWQRYIASLEKTKIMDESNAERSEHQLIPEKHDRRLIESDKRATANKRLAMISAVCVAVLFATGG